ncbi:MAG: PQQ-binding-like beta-propeller repeat protein [Planctomycetaceae bacterium]
MAYVVGVLLAFWFPSRIDDEFAIGMDVVMVATAFSGALLLLMWVGWSLFFSGWKWPVRIVVAIAMLAAPVVLLKVLRPVLSGDVTIARFEPIWSTRPQAPSAEVSGAESTVDLVTETPEDFPRFLGPDQNSIVSGSLNIAADRFSDSRIVWKQPIGEGWSGFVSRNGFAVTMEQRQDQECVTCYNLLTGELQWIHQHAARHRDAGNLGRIGPRSTPTIHDGRVYAVGAVGNFVCLDGSDGSVAWQVDLNSVLNLQLATDVDADGRTIQYEQNSRLAWGRSGSPLIFEDTVIVPGGGPRDGTLVTLLAFDRITGDLVWKGGSEMIAYGSPTLATVAGVPQILIVAENKVLGFQPDNGNVLWESSRPGASDGQANTSQAIPVGDNQVLTSKGYPDGGGMLIELSHHNGQLVPETVWNNPRVLKTKLMSPVIFEGHAYSLSNGFLECCRLSDGERVWKHRGRFGHGQMLLVDDRILLHTEDGELMLIRATVDGYEDFGSIPTIAGVCWNTLCLAGSHLLVRSELEAACVELPRQ